MKGAKLVEKLQQFYIAALAGHAVFAGLFLKNNTTDRLTGVIIARKDLLRTEHLQSIKRVDAERLDQVRLLAFSRVVELNKLFHENKKLSQVIHVWPVWAENSGKITSDDVRYHVNPGSSSGLVYGKPYTFDDLTVWATA